ncbi:MAG TPA: putative transporter small subunit [Pusillimonas sp.]|nr:MULTISPECIES: putative transporter small subunit [unclassified Pusillimonas]HLU20349.1 putative transporter small subunit [Pusillimonas sp.]
MNALGLSVYILIWPVISTGILIMLIVALIRDMRAARRSGEEMV